MQNAGLTIISLRKHGVKSGRNVRAKLSKINKNNDLISVILPVYNAQIQ